MGSKPRSASMIQDRCCQQGGQTDPARGGSHHLSPKFTLDNLI
ncbi:hypothetical protein CYA_1887 [Synechococcus sp. JA-3-3Ab]|nr:hypothetical protein CYA_1887 [Synechococcus sp. JA-3-3Ab]